METITLLLANTVFLVLITLVLLIVFLSDAGKTKKKEKETINSIKKSISSD